VAENPGSTINIALTIRQLSLQVENPQIYKTKINTFFEPKKERIKEIEEIEKSPFFIF
jgi:hypothetical protein